MNLLASNLQNQAAKTATHILKTYYGLDYPFRLRHLPQGRVNLSFQVETDTVVFLFQRLHPVFGPGPDVVHNVTAVTRSLTTAGRPCQKVVRTLFDELCVDLDGVWRLMSWLPGVLVTRRSPEVAMEAAKTLALFHQGLMQYPPRLTPLPPADYNQPVRSTTQDWINLISRFADDAKMPTVRPFLEKAQKLSSQWSGQDLPTVATIHGDPKQENIVFDESGAAVGLIDLDTVRLGPLVQDLADGLRSWASERRPHDQIIWQATIYKAAVDAYLHHGPKLTADELVSLPKVIQAMALNLARRYLEDYFQESYFTWDQNNYSSLSEQNLQRGLAMLNLAEQLA